MPDAAVDLRAELRRIGRRREKLREQSDELEADTADAVQRAKGVIGMGEVAELLGLHRTSLYATYGA